MVIMENLKSFKKGDIKVRPISILMKYSAETIKYDRKMKQTPMLEKKWA